jgi:hypothetical protein
MVLIAGKSNKVFLLRPQAITRNFACNSISLSLATALIDHLDPLASKLMMEVAVSATAPAFIAWPKNVLSKRVLSKLMPCNLHDLSTAECPDIRHK